MACRCRERPRRHTPLRCSPRATAVQPSRSASRTPRAASPAAPRDSPSAATHPTITTQPADQSVKAGQSAQFSVVASGTAPLTYQWRRNGAAISGATSASYAMPATATSDSGATFSVVVSNSAGSITSRAARLTVSGNRPDHHDATGRPERQGRPVRAVLSRRRRYRAAYLPVAQERRRDLRGDLGQLRHACHRHLRQRRNLQRGGQQFRRQHYQPRGAAHRERGSANHHDAAGQCHGNRRSERHLSVVATGTAPLTYQWQKAGAPISGATAASYTTPAAASSDSGSGFSVVVSNSAGTITSRTAVLTVSSAAPTITTQPADQSVHSGQTATFSVTASGSAPLTYQWRKNGTAIAGATGTQLHHRGDEHGRQRHVVLGRSQQRRRQRHQPQRTADRKRRGHSGKRRRHLQERSGAHRPEPQRDDTHAGQRQFRRVRQAALPEHRRQGRCAAAVPVRAQHWRRGAQRGVRRHRE